MPSPKQMLLIVTCLVFDSKLKFFTSMHARYRAFSGLILVSPLLGYETNHECQLTDRKSCRHVADAILYRE